MNEKARLAATAVHRVADGLAIQASHNGAENDLEDAIGLQAVGAPSGRVDHVANTLILEIIVQLSQSGSSTVLVADLEELDAHLVRRRLEGVELLGVVHDYGLGVIRSSSIGDDDDIDRLGRVHAVRSTGQASDVWLEDALQAVSRGGGACWADGAEKALYLVNVTDVVVSAGSLAL